MSDSDNENNKEIKENINNSENEEKENSNKSIEEENSENKENPFSNDDEYFQSLKCLRIQESAHRKYILYYKQYPKPNSKKFPQNLCAIFFHFYEGLEEKFFYLYISLIGQIESVTLGSFFNKKGSSSKRRMVYFAIVKFDEPSSLKALLNQRNTQSIVNNYLENIKHKHIDLDYDPLKGILNEEEEGEEDADGFVTVKRTDNKNRFSKGDISFKLNKINNDEDDDLYDNLKKKKKKEKLGDTYWNFQVLDKKRQSKNNLLILI